jgi:hypothetical protein
MTIGIGIFLVVLLFLFFVFRWTFRLLFLVVLLKIASSVKERMGNELKEKLNSLKDGAGENE